MRAVFVTGTDTDIGKTYVSALMCKTLVKQNLNVGYYKAAISGADAVFYLTPSSSLRILRDSDIPAVLDSIHAGALEITGISGAVGVDWDRTIENLLSGSASISYAFFPSED